MGDRLKGKVALISGAGSGTGMGAETARVFGREGAAVVVTDIVEDGIRALADELTAAGVDALPIVLDVTDRAQWDAAAAAAAEKFGTLDVLVNNAGTPGPGAGWEEATEEEVLRVLNVNTVSQFHGIQAVIPYMKAAGGGSIVNIASAASIIAYPQVHPGYTASKGGARLLSRSAAADLAKYGIRSNAVHPGLIETPMSIRFTSDKDFLASQLAGIPIGRVGTSRDIANMVLFLASDESSFVTGGDFVVDGGMTAL